MNSFGKGFRRRRTKLNKKRKVYIKISLVIIVILISGVLAKSIISKTTSKQQDKLEDSQNIKTNVEEESKTHDKDDIVEGLNVTYEGDKYTIDSEEVSKLLSGELKSDEKKFVFLTFDDGPTTATTQRILDILNEENVKATFFILGSNLEKEETKELLKKEIKEGHAIANHTYSHDMKKLYPNSKVDIDLFMNEINKNNELMKSILGEEFNTRVIRMPGGTNTRQYYKDPNLDKLDEALKKDNLVNIDWNALNGDAEGKPYTEEQMLDYVKRTSRGKHKVIILMHDAYGKDKTINILPQVIEYYKSEGFEFKTLK